MCGRERVSVFVCVRVCVRACMCVCACVCARVRKLNLFYTRECTSMHARVNLPFVKIFVKSRPLPV